MIFQSTLPTRGSDHKPPAIKAGGSYFNPRSPRGGATLFGAQGGLPSSLFQSTLPTRGSDPRADYTRRASLPFQSTLPTRGSDMTATFKRARQAISIHAPHEGERRGGLCRSGRGGCNFNPRSPRGGATVKLPMVTVSPLMISIHAPHEGERPYLNNFFTEDKHFNPRSPRGGATARRMPTGLRHGDFNPRSPRGGATIRCLLRLEFFNISIHAPHEGERR